MSKFVFYARVFIMKRSDAIVLASLAVLSIMSIVFQNAGGFLPLDLADFVFLSCIMFSFALYRPALTFFLFVGLLPFEIIDVAPQEIGLHLRPYQAVGMILVSALILRWFSGRLLVRIMRWHWIDACVVAVLLGSVGAALFSLRIGASLKQVAVVWSFGLLYFLTRYFVRSVRDAWRVAPFFGISSVIVAGYAFWQNMRFAVGLENFAVMEGRPNAMFAEPDWLGMYLLLALALGLTWFHAVWIRLWGEDAMKPVRHVWHEIMAERSVRRIVAESAVAWAYVVLISMALIITVVRSAWLGGVAMTAVSFLAYVWRTDRPISQWPWRLTFLEGIKILGAYVMAVGLVIGLHLTPFPLFERAQSTGGWQVITVACNPFTSTMAPPRISSVEELSRYGCRHIDLESVSAEEASGNVILSVERPDPNIGIRSSIYERVFSVLQRSWFAGIGWGSIGAFLGSDERGADLNASNAFLEVWLGSGLLGLAGFLTAWCAVLWVSVRSAVSSGIRDGSMRALAWFMLASGIGMTVFNLFNSGILLGFVWVWLAVGVALSRK